MKKAATPPPVRLVCGLLYREAEWLTRGMEDLQAEFGPSDFQSDPLEFHFTEYYFQEMGRPLYRVFASFAGLIDPGELAPVKVFTNSLESRYSASNGGARLLNIDPGYVSATAFIIATSKNYSHRIYLGQGVFAQQELLFEKKRLRMLEWTYPDYRSPEYQDIFSRLRDRYMLQLKEEGHCI